MGGGGGGEDLAVHEDYELEGLQEPGDCQLSKAASDMVLRDIASHGCRIPVTGSDVTSPQPCTAGPRLFRS